MASGSFRDPGQRAVAEVELKRIIAAYQRLQQREPDTEPVPPPQGA